MENQKSSGEISWAAQILQKHEEHAADVLDRRIKKRHNMVVRHTEYCWSTLNKFLQGILGDPTLEESQMMRANVPLVSVLYEGCGERLGRDFMNEVLENICEKIGLNFRTDEDVNEFIDAVVDSNMSGGYSHGYTVTYKNFLDMLTVVTDRSHLDRLLDKMRNEE